MTSRFHSHDHQGRAASGIAEPGVQYAKERIRFNAVAPGVVDTPLHAKGPREFLETLSPMGSLSTVDDIANAVVDLTEACQITGEVLHVGGAHNGR